MQNILEKRSASLAIVAFRGLAELGDILFATIVQVKIYNIVSSGVSIALLMLVRNLPIICIGVFAGTFVDNTKKSNLSILCLSLMGLLVLFTSFIDSSLIMILVIMGLYRSVYAFYKVSRSAIIPALLDKEDILKCISSVMIMQEIAVIVASFLIAKCYMHSAVFLSFLSVFCFFISILIIFFQLKGQENTFNKENSKYTFNLFFIDTIKGWQYLLHNRQLIILAIVVALIWFPIGGFSSIQIIYLSKVLLFPSHWVGVSESIISIGNMIGYSIVTIMARKYTSSLIDKMWIGYLIASCAMLVFSFNYSSFLFFAIFLFAYAIGCGVSNSIEESLEQSLPSSEYVGKSISIISTIGTVGYLVGITVFPILTDYMKIPFVIRLSSYSMFITFIIAFMNKRIFLVKKS